MNKNDNDIEQYKLKKLLKWLEWLDGKHTCLISLFIPFGEQIYLINKLFNFCKYKKQNK